MIQLHIYTFFFFFFFLILVPQFSSVTQLYLILCDPMDCSMPGFLSITNSRSLLKLMSIDWWCHPTISSSVIPFSSCLQSFPASGSFPWVSSSHQVAIVVELQLQSFQWIFRTDFLEDWLVGSPCSPRDSQESYPVPQFKSINSSVLSFLYGPTLTSIRPLEKPQPWLDGPLLAKWCLCFLCCLDWS